MKLSISKCTSSPANLIFLIDALGGDELQTSRHKHETIIDQIQHLMPEMNSAISNTISLHNCITAEDINSTFTIIDKKCNSNNFPLIFIDGHGEPNKGLALPSGEYLSWKDLNLALQRITFSAKGNSTVVASFCHSMNAVEKIPLNKPTPTPFYFGYRNEVQAGVIEKESELIIKELMCHGDFIKNGKTIELYSEYEHVIPQISAIIAKFMQPQKYSSKFPELSKNKLRKNIYPLIAEETKKTKGLNKAISRVLNEKKVIKSILLNSMHETERRKMLINDVMSSIDKIKISHNKK